MCDLTRASTGSATIESSVVTEQGRSTAVEQYKTLSFAFQTNNIIFACMKKVVVVGSGYLANIVADAAIRGLLPEYEFVGVYSQSVPSSERLADRFRKAGNACNAYPSLDAMLALKPDFLIEMASPSGMQEVAIPTLKNGTSIVCISVGAFADQDFMTEVKRVGNESGTRVYIASGATGGFDVLRTAALMGNATANFFNEKGHDRLRNSSVYDPIIETKKHIVFSGNANEAIRTFPTGLNVAVAASIASVGTDNMQVTMQSTPNFVGDTQRVEIKNDEVHAVVDVYSATPAIAAWSIVATLQNIVSPIVF